MTLLLTVEANASEHRSPRPSGTSLLDHGGRPPVRYCLPFERGREPFECAAHRLTVPLGAVIYAGRLLAELHRRLGPQVFAPLRDAAAGRCRFDAETPS